MADSTDFPQKTMIDFIVNDKRPVFPSLQEDAVSVAAFLLSFGSSIRWSR